MALSNRSTDSTLHPLARRLRAWWRRGAWPLADAANTPVTPWGDPHEPLSPGGNWTSDGLRAAQMIWGHALLGPCSPDELAAVAHWLQPRRNTRIALMGAGLGGFGVALSRICHCRVVGFEQAEVLLDLCPDRNQGHLRALDSITVKTEYSFDHAVIDGRSHRAGDITPLLKPAAALVSPRGSMLVRTYCLAEESIRRSAAYHRWAQTEPASPNVLTQVELARRLDLAGFEIVDRADAADMHTAAIDASWASAVELIRLLNGKPNQRSLIPALVREAELWRERVDMIRQGILQATDILARRPRKD